MIALCSLLHQSELEMLWEQEGKSYLTFLQEDLLGYCGMELVLGAERD